MLRSWFAGRTPVVCQVCVQPVAHAFLTLTSQHLTPCVDLRCGQ